MGAYTPHSGAAVITAATAAWQDLDLSAIVGTNRAVVVLELTGPGPLAVRAKGEVEDHLSPIVSGTKGNGFANCSTSRSGYIITKTDANGVIQYIDPAGVGWADDVFLMGYFVPSYAGTHLRDAAPGFGITASWSEQFIFSLHRPPAGRDALFQHTLSTDVNSRAIAIRPAGETGDDWKPFVGVYYMGANACRTFNLLPLVYPYYTVIADTDSTGAYGIVGDGAATINQTFTYWSEWDYYRKSRNTVFTNQVLPRRDAAWFAVDLSSYVGQRACLAVLRGGVNAGNPGNAYMALRTYSGTDTAHTLATNYGPGVQEMGSAPGGGAILLCPTDSLGRIEAAATQTGQAFDLELLGFVGQYPSVAPTIISGSISPTPGVYAELSFPDKIRFRLDDPSLSGIDTSTLTVTATDQIGRAQTLVTAGALASGLTGYVAPTDSAGIGGDPTEIELAIDWPVGMVSGQRYTISVDATNNMGLSL
jgi:hypothetical protein